MDDVDLYTVLGVPATAEGPELKRAYRREALRWHPDKCVDASKEEAESRFKQVNHAFNVLSDPQRRTAYDMDCELSDLSGPEDSADAGWRAWRQQRELEKEWCAAVAEQARKQRAREARTERTFLVGTIVTAAWLLLVALVLSRPELPVRPLFFPEPLRLSNRVFGSRFAMRTPFRDFTRELVAERAADVGELAGAATRLAPFLTLRTHTPALQLHFNSSDLSPLRSRASEAVLLASQRRVGQKVHRVHTFLQRSERRGATASMRARRTFIRNSHAAA